jgi:1-acyl-sn-glycerol-3-phosphate acyltransferase
MNLLKNILGRVAALWALLVFVVTLMLVILPVWIISRQPEPRRTRNVFRVFNPWMNVFFVLSGIRRRFVGVHHFKQGANYVVICNHNSFMDVPLSSPGIPGPNKTIAKVEMASIPVFGTIYRAGSVLVDRKSDQSRKQSYVAMHQVLQMGLHMCIYPEGTRNKGKEPIQKFHDGAFRLAAEAGKDIIPAVIFNTGIVMPRNKMFYIWPHSVEMHFLAPIIVAGKTAEDLKEESFRIMLDYYVANRQK